MFDTFSSDRIWQKGVNKPSPVSALSGRHLAPGLTRNVKITKLSVKLGPMQRRRNRGVKTKSSTVCRQNYSRQHWWCYISRYKFLKNYTWLIEMQISSDNQGRKSGLLTDCWLKCRNAKIESSGNTIPEWLI